MISVESLSAWLPEGVGAWLGTHETLLWLTGGLSALGFVATLIAVPLIVLRIPADYFARERRAPTEVLRIPAAQLLLVAVKNLVGSLLLLAGIAMLVLPGQGLLTMLIGLMLMNFPGKFRLERWLVSRPRVMEAINWLRQRRGRAPLQSPTRN